MHKRIAKIINKMIKESPYHNTCFTSEIIPNRGSNGFWQMRIYFIDRDNAHSSSLVKSLYHIGMVYGEGLNIEDSNKEVFIS